MHVGLLLQMAADGMGERIALGPRSNGVTMAEMASRARRAGTVLSDTPGERVALVDLNSEAVPIALFGATLAGKPFVPINYRLTDEQLRDLVRRTAPATVITGDGVADRLGAIPGIEILERADFLERVADPSVAEADPYGGDPDSVAVLLYTSGTTGAPKAAVLRNRNLTSYVISTVEFAGAGEDEAAIVSVPPYHIAGISSVLSSTYSGRRVVHIETFEPHVWVDLVRAESVTHAMVVPTMLNRILDVIAEDEGGLPSLRSLSYGGGPMSLAVIERAMALLPGVGFVNAYGLTETASTIALLGPDDHREAHASEDPAVRVRLASVGRPLPTVEVVVRGEDGTVLAPGARGEIWVRGEQVAGEYEGHGSGPGDGWFNTRDEGHLDEAGYLFVHGRLDDVIVRGGENLSPVEIETVLMEYPGVGAAAVVGIPDPDWGEKVVAAVVPVDGAVIDEDELRAFVREALRSTKTPERIAIRDDLPFNETGKLLRRVLREELAARFG
ncbi:MAG: class I adenylate-forming enzyme family protein [Acidimicrobiales bacterium]